MFYRVIACSSVIATACCGLGPWVSTARAQDPPGQYLGRIDLSFPNDVVHDPIRGLVYVSSQAGQGASAQVRRYDLATGAALEPLQGPANAAYWGISLSPDGRYLFAADRNAPQVTRFDLVGGTSDAVTFPAPTDPRVTALDVAVASNGVGFITTTFPGSGHTQTRRFEPGALTARAIEGTFAPAGLYNQASMFPDATGTSIFFVESGTTGGYLARYDAATDSYARSPTTYVELDGRAGLSPDGSRLVTGTGYLGNVGVFERDLTRQTTFSDPNLTGASAIQPGTGDIYVLAGDADQIWVYDPQTFTRRTAFAVGEEMPDYNAGFPFGAGRMTFTADGSRLLVITYTGVRQFLVPEPGAALACTCLAFLLRRPRRQ